MFFPGLSGTVTFGRVAAGGAVSLTPEQLDEIERGCEGLDGVAEFGTLREIVDAEQRYLAFLIGVQRHRIDAARIKSLPKSWRTAALRLAILLRIAVLLNRGRSAAAAPELGISVNESSISLRFDDDWLAANPLTVADLERERAYLHEVGYALDIGTD